LAAVREEHGRKTNTAFRDERDWQQFHDPKNLAEPISLKLGDLLEDFLSKTTEQSRYLTKRELSDIFIVFT